MGANERQSAFHQGPKAGFTLGKRQLCPFPFRHVADDAGKGMFSVLHYLAKRNFQGHSYAILMQTFQLNSAPVGGLERCYRVMGNFAAPSLAPILRHQPSERLTCYFSHGISKNVFGGWIGVQNCAVTVDTE